MSNLFNIEEKQKVEVCKREKSAAEEEVRNQKAKIKDLEATAEARKPLGLFSIIGKTIDSLLGLVD